MYYEVGVYTVVGRGVEENSLLSDPGSELGLEGEKKEKYKVRR